MWYQILGDYHLFFMCKYVFTHKYTIKIMTFVSNVSKSASFINCMELFSLTLSTKVNVSTNSSNRYLPRCGVFRKFS